MSRDILSKFSVFNHWRNSNASSKYPTTVLRFIKNQEKAHSPSILYRKSWLFQDVINWVLKVQVLRVHHLQICSHSSFQQSAYSQNLPSGNPSYLSVLLSNEHSKGKDTQLEETTYHWRPVSFTDQLETRLDPSFDCRILQLGDSERILNGKYSKEQQRRFHFPI